MSPLDQKPYHGSNLYHMLLVGSASKNFFTLFLSLKKGNSVRNLYWLSTETVVISIKKEWENDMNKKKNKMISSTYNFMVELISYVFIYYNSRWKSKNNNMNGLLCKLHHFPFWKRNIIRNQMNVQHDWPATMIYKYI